MQEAAVNVAIDAVDNTLVHKAYEQQAVDTPDNVAIRYRDSQITYQELDHAANTLAARMRAAGVRAGDIVGLAMYRAPEMIAAMLAVLKCGAAYLPLDSQSPTSRVLACIDEARVHLLLANKNCENLLTGRRQSLWVDDVATLAAANESFASADVSPEHKAYVMYTSGSTGGPKGVVVPHRAIHRLVHNTDYIDIQPGDHVLHVSPPEFDASTFEVWGPLLNGATTVLYPEKTIDPNLLARVIKDNHITIVFLTSALFHLIAARFTQAFETVQYVLTGGDVVSPKVINSLFDAYPEINIISCYGPTENTTFTTTHPMTTTKRPGSTVPIGKPIRGTAVHVLDEQLKPVAKGDVGELFTSGPGVALGYMNREKNADTFFSEPAIAPGLIYRTGDLVRENKAGELEFVGRKDNQVKLRGFRMSLEEVQAAILDLDYVIDATVAIDKQDNGEKYLVAFTRLQSGITRKIGEIKRDLSAKLPAYMIPDVIYTDVELCINKNGKIDKNKVREILAR